MRLGPLSVTFGPSKIDRFRRQVADAARVGHLVRLSLPSGVSFVGRPRVDGDTVVLRHATRDAIAHVVDLVSVAAVTDIAVARPSGDRARLDDVAETASRLDGP